MVLYHSTLRTAKWINRKSKHKSSMLICKQEPHTEITEYKHPLFQCAPREVWWTQGKCVGASLWKLSPPLLLLTTVRTFELHITNGEKVVEWIARERDDPKALISSPIASEWHFQPSPRGWRLTTYSAGHWSSAHFSGFGQAKDQGTKCLSKSYITAGTRSKVKRCH